MTPGTRIKLRREMLKISRADLARMAGVPYSTLAGLENGDQTGSTKLWSIAKALQCEPRWLETGSGPMVEPAGSVDILLRESSPTAYYAKDADIVAIPQMNVGGSMGDGAAPPNHPAVLQHITARISELRKQCTFSAPENLQLITGYGRSMMPTFSDGDILLIDTGIRTVELDAVYVFSIASDLFIKGLQRLPGNRLRVISHNREENDPWDITDPQMQQMAVHGRVVLAWNARRL